MSARRAMGRLARRFAGMVATGTAILSLSLLLVSHLPAPWNGVARAVADGVTQLADLTDVDDALAPAAGQVLTYLGSQWGAATPAAGPTQLTSLSDVDPALAPSSGQRLRWDGSKWAAATAPSSACFSNYEMATQSTTVSQSNTGSVIVTCPGGKAMVSGGCLISTTHLVDFGRNRPSGSTGWECGIYNGRTLSPFTITLTAYAVCATLP